MKTKKKQSSEATILCNKPQCVNNNEGTCMALQDTRFDKPCPFYKETVNWNISKVPQWAREKYGIKEPKKKK